MLPRERCTSFLAEATLDIERMARLLLKLGLTSEN